MRERFREFTTHLYNVGIKEPIEQSKKPEWRAFFGARLGIAAIAGGIGYFTGHNIDPDLTYSGAALGNFVDYLPKSLATALPALAVRIALEPLAAILVYHANREKYKSKREFLKDYFGKVQSIPYAIDGLSGALTLSTLQSIGLPYGLSVLLNGKLSLPISFLTNAILYKFVIVDRNKAETRISRELSKQPTGTITNYLKDF